MPSPIETVRFQGYDFELMPNGTVNLRWVAGAPTTFSLPALWSIFQASAVYAASPNFSSMTSPVFPSGIFGSPGSDHITGSAFRDRIIAGGGDDSLYGGDASDWFFGGSGRDSYFGGDHYFAEPDVVDYSAATAGVTANLAAPTYNKGEAAGETYSGIEGLSGSAFNDILNGDENSNWLAGGAGADLVTAREGADTIVASGGADTLDGGVGTDTLIFVGRTAIQASLTSGTATGASNSVALNVWLAAAAMTV